MTFGERLYELRKEKNISQEELAELLDVSRQSISKWENDKAYPEMTRLLFMSDYFGVSLDYLMRGTENQKTTPDANIKYKTNGECIFTTIYILHFYYSLLLNLRKQFFHRRIN